MTRLLISCPSAPRYASRICYEAGVSHRTNSEGRVRLILVSWRQGHCERRDYRQVRGAAGAWSVTFLTVKRTKTVLGCL